MASHYGYVEKPLERLVLLPVDGSEHSERAFNWYLRNLHRHGDKVGIMNVVEPPTMPASFVMMGPVVVPDEWHQEVKESVERSKKTTEMFKEKCDKAGVPCTVYQETCDFGAGEKICQLAKDKGASSIVMGSRGLNFLRRTLLGSVSSYVVNHAHVPVVVTPPDMEEQKKD